MNLQKKTSLTSCSRLLLSEQMQETRSQASAKKLQPKHVSKRMRICHVSSCFPPSRGGVETFVYSLCKKLAERGHRVKVITSNRGKPPKRYHEIIDGIEVIRYPEKYHFFEAPIIPRIALSLLHEDYDVLHVHGMVPSISDLSLVVNRLKGKPSVLTYHCDAETPTHGYVGMLAARGYASMARPVLKLAQKVVATTKSYAETSAVLSSFLERIEIIPCGVNADRFSLDMSHQDSAKSKSGHHQILFVGKLIHYKGVDVLIKAFKIVSESHNCSLTIVGDGEQRDELTAMVKKLKLCDRVVFAGNVSTELLPQYYQSSDLLVLPSIASRREAFGMVLLEAMASGIPVIASNIPGPNEVVQNGKNGYLTPTGNVEKLACAIINSLNNSRTAYERSRAHDTVEEIYDWSVIATRYESLYRSLVE